MSNCSGNPRATSPSASSMASATSNKSDLSSILGPEREQVLSDKMRHIVTHFRKRSESHWINPILQNEEKFQMLCHIFQASVDCIKYHFVSQVGTSKSLLRGWASNESILQCLPNKAFYFYPLAQTTLSISFILQQ